MTRKNVESGEQMWLKAFNSGDAAGVAAMYTENARLLPPNSDILQGRTAIEPFIKGFIATGAQLAFSLLDVHEAGNLAVSIGTYRLTIPGAAEERGKFIEVWQRQGDGSWRIVDDIFNSSEPPPA